MRTMTAAEIATANHVALTHAIAQCAAQQMLTVHTVTEDNRSDFLDMPLGTAVAHHTEDDKGHWVAVYTNPDDETLLVEYVDDQGNVETHRARVAAVRQLVAKLVAQAAADRNGVVHTAPDNARTLYVVTVYDAKGAHRGFLNLRRNSTVMDAGFLTHDGRRATRMHRSKAHRLAQRYTATNAGKATAYAARLTTEIEDAR